MFKIGDVVRLKSDQTPMTVCSVENGSVKVIWLDNTLQVQEWYFNINMLVHSDK